MLGFPVVGKSAQPYLVQGPTDVGGPRVDHCEIALGNGRVLILGGVGPNGAGGAAPGFGTLSSAEYTVPDGGGSPLNDPGTVLIPSLVQTEGSLRTPRAGMACTLLRDGSVLVTGGYTTPGPIAGNSQTVKMLSSVEVYRPIPLSISAPAGP